MYSYICYGGAVLMQLGFMSLILTVTSRSISKICISNKVAERFLPCERLQIKKTQNLWISFQHNENERVLAAAAASNSSDYCGSKV